MTAGQRPTLDDLLIDRNEDGFPDDIAVQFIVTDDLGRECWEALINLAARLGLHTSGFTPPLIATTPDRARRAIPITNDDATWLNELANTIPESDTEPNDAPGPAFSDINETDLTMLWRPGGLVVDLDDDISADDAAIHLVLPANVTIETGAALVDLAARIGIECHALRLPLAGETPLHGRIPLIVEETDDDSARLEQSNEHELRLSGDSEAIRALISEIVQHDAGFLGDEPIRRGAEWLRQSLAGWTTAGRAAALQAALASNQPERITILDSDDATRRALHQLVSQEDPSTPIGFAEPHDYVVFDHQWTAEWEIDRLMKTLESEILPRMERDKPFTLYAIASEPPHILRRLRGAISRRMLSFGFSGGTVHVLDAYKPGLSWIEGILLPELQTIGPIETITITFREWPPARHVGQLDMRIRWLQELFPVDELLAKALRISTSAISFVADPDAPTIYRLTATDAEGHTLLDQQFSPLWRRIDYLAGMPSAGNVTVTTGGIIVEQAGRIRRAHVLTDPEVFWRYVQGELQPHLRRFILNQTNGEPAIEDQPFFDDLMIDVRISESDHPYGIREERHSAAEALHEDIYFNILDFVEELGRKTTGAKLSAPGAIRPFVTVTPGRQPEARIRLQRRPAAIARITSTTGVTIDVQPARQTLPVPARVEALCSESGQLVVEINANVPASFAEALATVSPPRDGQPVLRLQRTDDTTIDIGIPDPDDEPAHQQPASMPIPWDSIIGTEDTLRYLHTMAEHPNVQLVPVAERSFQGRPIPAIGLFSPHTTPIWSLRKLSAFKPTILIVARHHANEPASTTAALQLVDLLTDVPDWNQISQQINILMLPLENPDGAELHDLLRSQNPTWKHHPARYNAVGYEFGEDQGNRDSRYGEGRVRDRLWHSCLPDVVVDNHGVPSHEWAQIFAGFGSPPRFNVSYWQVQALLYGIIPYVDDPAHVATGETVRDAVAAAVHADDDLREWNEIFGERYRSWGHQWLPDRFPMQTFQGMIFHTGPVEPDSPRGRRSYAVRYPRTTVLNWVTEVCDETVEGATLRRTARAHLLANQTLLRLLAANVSEARPAARTSGGAVSFNVGRQRPLTITDHTRHQ